jgi:anti-sigma factor RsiW
MRSSAPIEEADLHALVDGEISIERRREVEDHLRAHPEDAALIENWRRQNAALHAAFQPVAQETTPLSLRNAAARNAAPGAPPIETGAIHWGRPSSASRGVRRPDEAHASRRRQKLLSVAAALAAALALASAGFFFLKRPAVPSAMRGFIDRANVSYITYAQDPRPFEFDAGHRDVLLETFARRVGFARAPDLAPLELRLLGGRVMPGVRGPAALLFYEKPESVRVALYYERTEPGPLSRVPPHVEEGLVASAWRGAGMGFVLIGPLGVEEMQRVEDRAIAEALATAPGAPAQARPAR